MPAPDIHAARAASEGISRDEAKARNFTEQPRLLFGPGESLIVVAANETIMAACKQIADVRSAMVKRAQPLVSARYAELCLGLRSLIKANPRTGEGHHEFFRRAITNDFRDTPHPLDFYEAVRFVRSYHVAAQLVYRGLLNVYTGRSDDGFSDLCDALPLAPIGLVKELLDAPAAFEEWEKKHDEEIHDLLHGELYNSMSLHDALEAFLPGVAYDFRRQER